MADMFEAIDTCPVPVIARVHGAALGGGMGLCAVADLVIAESGHAVRVHRDAPRDPARRSISPFVIAKIGESHARALFPGGRRFDATRAARIGLVHEIVEGEAALDAAVDAAVADLLAVGADRGAGRQGDRPRGPRPGPRLGEVAHGAGHRAPAHDRGGPGGLPRLQREAPPAWAPAPEDADRGSRDAICDDRDTMPEELSPSEAARRSGRRRGPSSAGSRAVGCRPTRRWTVACRD